MTMYNLYINNQLVHKSNSLDVLNKFAGHYLFANDLYNVSVEVILETTNYLVIAKRMGF